MPTSRSGRGLLAMALLSSFLSGAFAGTAQLELTSVTGTGCNANPVAKCFNSFTVTSSGTNAIVAPNDPGDSSAIYVPALFTGGNAYTELIACPAAGASNMSASGASVAASLNTVFSSAIWATPLTTYSTALNAGNDGITVTAGSCTLVWQAVSSSVAGITAASGTPSCTAGTYKVAANVCALCRAGSYTSGSGATACTTVAAGKALSTVGSTADGSSCTAGTYAESAGTSDCVPCPVGTISASNGATTCTACPGGAYAYVPGASRCVVCVAGRAATCVDSGTCTAQGTPSAGYAVATSALVVSSCPASKPAMFTTCVGSTVYSFYVKATCEVVITPMNDLTATSNGLTCSTPSNSDYTVTGYYTSDTTIMSLLTGASGSIVKVAYAGATTATITVSDASTDPNATPAAACSGTLNVTGAKLATAGVTTCPAGSVLSGSGATLACAPCPAGSFCVDSATTSDCTAGTANPNIGTTSTCGDCSAGQYSDAGATQCSLCDIGTYSASPGSGSCAACLGAATAGQSTCDNSCGTKEFRNPSTGECEVCPAGYGVTLVGDVPTCSQCLAGYESPADSAICTQCVDGTYAATPGTPSCNVCAGGLKGNGAGASSCLDCDAGSESVANSTSCTACAAGYYRPLSGSASNALCTKCPSGYLTDATTGSVTCSKCPIGSYAAWTDSTTRFPAVGNTCQPCAAGTANAKKGQKVCISCPGGQYTEQNGTTAGSDASYHGAVTCTACTAGLWRPAFSPSTEACQSCAAGSETTVASGATTCTTCAPGTYASSGGTSFCSDCPANQSSDEGATGCSNCPAGTDTVSSGGNDCAPCVPGTVNPTDGQACAECPAGSYQDVEGKTSCKKCAVGFYNADTGADSCLSCPAGRYNNVQGATSCKTCPAGTSSVGGSGSCALCSAGFYSAAGSRTCTACPIGTYASKTGAAACTKCPPGSFCDTKALAAAKRCPAGQYAATSGQKACKKCPVNTYAAGTGSSACKKCAAGSNTDKNIGATSCSSRRRRRALLAGAESS